MKTGETVEIDFDKQTVKIEPLALDVDQARALHRVVRAMHDGECPKCHRIHDSKAMRDCHRIHDSKAMRDACGWTCPSCGFWIEKDEADAILAEFGSFMDRSCEIFENWRAKRQETASTVPSDTHGEAKA